MIFRKSVENDVHSIMEIIKQAQDSFKEAGIDQWQNGYPNHDVIVKDIMNSESYVLEHDGVIAATSMVTFAKEPSYKSIRNGKWLSDGEYATIHRIAVNHTYKGMGLATTIIQHVEALCANKQIPSIKADTHEANIPMQKTLKKNGFELCGTITLDGGEERLAYEKLL
ncbi:GNAT family N-acetyltransferase [Peribacillus kribbensis]|uniref:GNAT family N-acetyltransferase n=1 Tax=Peribacillus kribbensis TaxID=356658 RepID=UPI00042A2AE9|nr:GNAT family N-acetyltransferase [Peribacillus kribbensis]